MKTCVLQAVRTMATTALHKPITGPHYQRSWSVKECVSHIQQCKSLRDLEVISSSIECDPALSTNLFVKTALLNRFSNHSETISKCVSVFNSIPNGRHDLVITCSMMNAFIKHNQSRNALLLFDTVKNNTFLVGHSLHKLSYFYSLGIKACIRCNDHSKGLEIHSLLRDQHPMLYRQNHFINTSLITFYGHFGDTQSAVSVFHDAAHFNVASLNAVMTVLTEHRRHLHALWVYTDFECEHGAKYDDITHLLALKLCINANDHLRGRQIVDRLDIDRCSIEMRNTVIDFHGHFKDIDRAMDLFHGMADSLKTAVTMTVVLKALINNNALQKALKLYGHDRYQHLLWNQSHILALRACILSNRHQLGLDIV